MLVKAYSAAVNGLDVTTITIECSVTAGVMYHFTGLGDAAVREGRDRINAAFQHNGYRFPHADVTINMAPADLRKEGSGFDLPLAIAILAANEKISFPNNPNEKISFPDHSNGNVNSNSSPNPTGTTIPNSNVNSNGNVNSNANSNTASGASGRRSGDTLSKVMMVGELGLDGSLQPVKGALPIALRAQRDNFSALILPKDNAPEAAVVAGLEVYGLSSLAEVIEFLANYNGNANLNSNSNLNSNGNGKRVFLPYRIDTYREFYERQYEFEMDFADVRGQENVKRAMEVAAAGGHNMIMIGPPGSGKSMMAKRLPSILPPLSLEESLETTQIHSVAGKLTRGSSLITQRPFRSPHHTISEVALVGGGTNPQPGEISLAHNGVLFCDELPEFNKSTLEVLRQPLEDRRITISRAKYTTEFPCSFMFVASANPCPCGYFGDPQHKCVCTPGQRARYMNKISGPMLDRIDLQVEITPVPFKDISKAAPGEPSASIRERVIRARRMQEERFRNNKLVHSNAQMTERMIHEYAEPDEAGIELLRMAMEKFSLSARAYNRILKVARTIADLEGSEMVRPEHLAEAISYRKLDRNDWAVM